MKGIILIMVFTVLFFQVFSQKIDIDRYIFTIRAPGTAKTDYKPTIHTGFRMKDVKGIITCLHGVVGGTSFSAVNENNFRVTKLKIISVDIANDIAILSSQELDNLPAEGIEKTNKRVSEKYFVVGHPAGINLYKKPVSIDPSNYKDLARLIPPASSGAFNKRNSPAVTIKIININSGNLVPGN